jgi:hypothetical protein
MGSCQQLEPSVITLFQFEMLIVLCAYRTGAGMLRNHMLPTAFLSIVNYLHTKVSAIGNDQQQFLHLFRLRVFSHFIKRHDQVPEYPAHDLKA